MADLLTAGLIPLASAARQLGVAPSTVSRWVSRGIIRPDGSRLRLAAIRLGGRLRVDPAALQAFLAALSGQQAGPEVVSPVERAKRCESAMRELESMGA